MIIGDNMIDNFIKSFKETTYSVIPICFIVVILSAFFNIESSIIVTFVISAFFLIVGISLFTFGADISMMLIGEKLGNKLIQSKKISKILIITLIIGFIITLAEPDLKVLASQIPSIPQNSLIIFVSIGVGIFLMLAALKILLKLSFRAILIICYTLTFILMFISPQGIIPIAFDSSGVTTGPISVPFILALGIGLTSLRTDSNTKNDTFGLIALCSIGPKIAVLILGMIYQGSNNFDTSIYLKSGPIIVEYVDTFLECFKEVFISISPIIALFIILKVIQKDLFTNAITNKIVLGLTATFLGLCTFLTSVNVGFMKMGYLLGTSFANTNHLNILFPVTMIIGFLVVFAEPAIKILTNEIEDITEGSVSKNIMKVTISLGVSLAIFFSIHRMINGYSIIPYLIVTYLASFILMFTCPKMFTSASFDAGGSVCGPLTATFILPLVIGVCNALNGNIITDAFGLISFIAMSPFITVQLLGIIFRIKTRVEIDKNINEEIVDFDWRSAL